MMVRGPPPPWGPSWMWLKAEWTRAVAASGDGFELDADAGCAVGQGFRAVHY